jgi:hypothetical protein
MGQGPQLGGVCIAWHVGIGHLSASVSCHGLCNALPAVVCTWQLSCLLLQLEVIMSRLLDVGSAVATPVASSSEHKLAKVQFPKDSTAQLEVCTAASDAPAQAAQQMHPCCTYTVAAATPGY